MVETILDRLMRYVLPEPNSGCWLWMGPVMAGGYGQLSFCATKQYAHRVAYNLLRGEIPQGLDLDHLCRVRCCVNPDHLEPVTRRENLRRGINGASIGGKIGGKIFGARQRAKTHCPRGHEYTQENTYLYGTNRQCKACKPFHSRSAYARQKAKALLQGNVA